jgi:hypothetical protein
MKGRALPFCPVRSDVDLLCDGEGIVHIMPRYRMVLSLGVTEQKLDARKFPGAAVDQRRFSSPQ